MKDLPIAQVIPELKHILNNRHSAVLIAEPGAGKTTQVPLALLSSDWLGTQKIVMLEPRRLAARSAARYMAESLGETVGETVGYRVRMDSKVGANTRIEVVTEGVLTRMLQSDPELAGVGLILFDEFHERNLQGDLGLALALESQSVLREDLRILIMSATLEAAPVASLMGEAPVITCPGRQYPVQTNYVPQPTGAALDRSMATVICKAISENDGDVLAFLPGVREIRQVQRELESRALPPDCVVLPLYGQLRQEQQDAAIRPDPAGRRKIVLSTSIAETSLTIQGVRIVVDSGLARTQVFSPRTGMPYLATVKVSKASADQRRGRAGRTETGVVYRLWSREEQDFLKERNTPEIVATDLAPLVLELTAWGVRDPRSLLWLDPPPEATYNQGSRLLTELGAIDEMGNMTELGRKMAALGMHPRLSRMVLKAQSLGHGKLACLMAALLQERDPFSGQLSERNADIGARVEALLAWEQRGSAGLSSLQPDEALLQRMMMESRNIQFMLSIKETAVVDAKWCGVLLSMAYPDRIGQARGDGKYMLASGRGVEMGPDQPLSREPYIVAAQVDDRGTEGRVQLAASISEEDLYRYHREYMMDEMNVSWDKQLQAVKARKRTRLGSVTLKESPDAQPSNEEIASALLDGIREEGLRILPWSKQAAQLRQRMQYMHMIDPQWPDVSDAALLSTIHDWLLPYVDGMRNRKDLERLQLSAILEQRLTWEQRRQLDQEVPTHITVPSGSRIAIDYSTPGQPVLAVKLQEMFGMQDTPRLGGTIPLTLHLLSPAQRPVQVTSDLASFWKTGYFEVKKDLKGRYPKHYWPDDPLQAVPTRRVRPK